MAVTIKPRNNLGKDILDAFEPHYQKMQAIPGWLEDSEATALFTTAYTLKAERPVAVEIGSFQGKSSVCIAGGLRAGGRLYCIDPFDLTDESFYIARAAREGISKLYDTFLKNTEGYPITPVPGFSAREACNKDSVIPSEIDMLFIDGNHEYGAVRNDVLSWVPSLKTNGVLAMHDVCMPGLRKSEPGQGWCTGPIRVVCDYGLGLHGTGWSNAFLIDTLFIAIRSEGPLWDSPASSR